MTTQLWYVSYGSNLLAARLHTYLTGSPEGSEFGAHPPAPTTSLPEREHWLWIDHALYFAGVSQRWGGSAAFVSPDVDPSTPSLAHGYLVEQSQFEHLITVENVVDRVDIPGSLEVGRWAQVRMDTRGETFRGKYDALLRLPDIDGTPAYTLTSSRVRERGMPSDRYLATIERGVRSSALDLDVDEYLQAAKNRSATLEITSGRRGRS